MQLKPLAPFDISEGVLLRRYPMGLFMQQITECCHYSSLISCRLWDLLLERRLQMREAACSVMMSNQRRFYRNPATTSPNGTLRAASGESFFCSLNCLHNPFFLQQDSWVAALRTAGGITCDSADSAAPCACNSMQIVLLLYVVMRGEFKNACHDIQSSVGLAVK